MSKTKETVLVIFLLLVLAGLIYAARILFLRAKELQVTPSVQYPTQQVKKEPVVPSTVKPKVDKYLSQEFEKPLPTVVREQGVALTTLPTWAKALMDIAELEPVTHTSLAKVEFSSGGTGYKFYFTKQISEDMAQYTYFMRRRFEAKGKNEYYVNYKYIEHSAAVEVRYKEFTMSLVYSDSLDNLQEISGYALFW